MSESEAHKLEIGIQSTFCSDLPYC